VINIPGLDESEDLWAVGKDKETRRVQETAQPGSGAMRLSGGESSSKHNYSLHADGPMATYTVEVEGDVGGPRRQITLPLEIGTRVMCMWRDEKHIPARIVERMKGENGCVLYLL
jgi:hypothetical protein